jgi:pyruvate ferredoxin oxidoreductase gamma subunit
MSRISRNIARRQHVRRRESMFQVRLHGRGGQGVVTAAELLSIAAFGEGRHAQAFPSFGSERMGAPVTAFCRIDDKPIRLREPVMQPDALIIQDPTLLHQVDLFSGLASTGWIVINSTRDAEALGIADYVGRFPAGHVCIVGASELAMKHVGRPLPNAALLGAFAAVSGQLHLDSVARAIRNRFSGTVGEANVAAAEAAHALAADLVKESLHAHAD